MRLLLILFLLPLPVHVATATATDDGPYIHYREGHLQARWICDGAPRERKYPSRDWPVAVMPECGYDRPLHVRAPAEPDESVLSGVQRIAALSDVHGQYALMVSLLQAHGVIDNALDWRFGDGWLVMTGDVFDRGDKVTEVFWLLYTLEQQARDAGGGVLFLLGNHETMVLYDDLRYVNPKYLRSAEILGVAHADLYDEHSVLGQWLRSKSVIGKIDDLLFLHAGISPGHLELAMDIDQVNAAYRRSLGTPRPTLSRHPILSRLYDGRHSPIWYRGYFQDPDLSQAQVDDIVVHLGVSRIVVGHTSMEEIDAHFRGRIIAIDSSIKDGVSGELLLIEDGHLQRGLLDGRRQPLRNLPREEAPDDDTPDGRDLAPHGSAVPAALAG